MVEGSSLLPLWESWELYSGRPPSLCKHLYLLSHYISSMCLLSWDSSLSARLLCSQEWVSCLHLSNAGSYIPLKSACVRLGIRVCALCGRQAHYWTTTPEYEDGGGHTTSTRNTRNSRCMRYTGFTGKLPRQCAFPTSFPRPWENWTLKIITVLAFQHSHRKKKKNL